MTTLAAPVRRGFVRRHAVKLVASALITGGVIFTAATGRLKLVPESGDFGAVRSWGVALYFPLFLGMTWFRSVRWRFLLRSIIEVPKRRLLAVSCVGFLVILLLPFRLGEAARPYMLRTRPEDRRAGVPVLTMSAAAGSVIAERVIDGMFLSIVLAFVLIFVPTVHPLPEYVVGVKSPVSVAWVRIGAFVILGIFTAALGTIAVFYFKRVWAHRTTHVVIGKLSPRLADTLAGVAEKLADGLHVFSRGRDALGFLAETAIYWALNALGMWILAMGCGVVHADGSAITFPEVCGLMGLFGCAILIPSPPGLLGVFQLGIYAGMTFYCPADVVLGPGAAYAFLLYLSQLVLHLATASWGLWHEGGARRLRGALEESPLAVEATST